MKRVLIILLCFLVGGWVVGCHKEVQPTTIVQSWEEDILTKEYVVEHSSLTEEDLSLFDFETIAKTYKLTKTDFNVEKLIDILDWEAESHEITSWKGYVKQGGKSGSAKDDAIGDSVDLTGGGLNVDLIDITQYQPAPTQDPDVIDVEPGENVSEPEYVKELTNKILSGLLLPFEKDNP